MEGVNKNIEDKEKKSNEKALEDFVNDLEQYDKDHGHGAWMGRSMAARMMGSFESEDEDGSKTQGDQKGLENLRKRIEANSKIQDVIDHHKKTLEKLGLELDSPNKEGDIDEAETYAVGEIEIDLFDKDKYVTFLKSIKEGEITPAQEKILNIIGRKLAYQFRTKYDLGEPDNQLLELLSGLNDIINEYKRLGIDSGMKDLAEYLENANSGYLREYVLAKNRHLFEPIGEGFNLSTYQRDASYEVYVRNWDYNLFETLKEIEKNPDAGELRNKILNYARECIAFAETDLDNLALKNYSEKYMKGITKAISEVKEKLSKEA